MGVETVGSHDTTCFEEYLQHLNFSTLSEQRTRSAFHVDAVDNSRS